MRVRSIRKLAFLSVTDIHTNISTQNDMQSKISNLALRLSANIEYVCDLILSIVTQHVLCMQYVLVKKLYSLVLFVSSSFIAAVAGATHFVS